MAVPIWTLKILIPIAIKLLNKKSNVSFSEAELIQQLLNAAQDVFKKAERTCFDKNHKCNYKEGSCAVLLTKGGNWTMDDITTCPYREKIK